ncbi:MAG: RnfABCDGE type electron transport complex subunit D, partial [Spirochaetes bacterium]|nr:RnfABCDGE type electron transport complex subunit D [Spirochaetota bacterium]
MTERKDALIHRPQINTSLAASKRMWLVFTVATLCVLQSALSDGGRSLLLALAAVLTAVAIELFLTWRQYGFGKIKDGSAAASALVLVLLLPNQIYPMYAAFAAAFAIAVVKFSFGGLGSNWLNPALGGWIFIRFSWPAAFSRALEHSPYYTGELWGAAPAGSFDIALTSFLNRNLFAFAGADLPSGYFELLYARGPGFIADRGILALLIGSILLSALRVSRFYIPVVFLFVFGLLTRIFGDLPFGGQFWSGDILWGFFSGGTIAAAFILAAEPVSGAKTKYGALALVTAA